MDSPAQFTYHGQPPARLVSYAFSKSLIKTETAKRITGTVWMGTVRNTRNEVNTLLSACSLQCPCVSLGPALPTAATPAATNPVGQRLVVGSGDEFHRRPDPEPGTLPLHFCYLP